MIPRLITGHPIAYESHDHIEPKGTKHDNLHSARFAEVIVEAFGLNMRYCDLGTAGGGIVKDFIDQGVLAVGIDGSDYSKRHQRAEWATIPDYLHTADITKPWVFVDDNDVEIKFDLITSFDVLEHMKEEQISDVLTYINLNLKVGGYTLHSIAEFPDEGYHHTLKPKGWWIDLFGEFGFAPEEIIQEKDYARTSSHNLCFVKVRGF